MTKSFILNISQTTEKEFSQSFDNANDTLAELETQLYYLQEKNEKREEELAEELALIQKHNDAIEAYLGEVADAQASIEKMENFLNDHVTEEKE